MTGNVALISIDYPMILRVLLAFAWGIGFATYLETNRHGQFLVSERTWLTVVIGIGVDLLIAYPGDWWTVLTVIAASSVGIIARSLMNEQQRDTVNWQGYKVKHGLEDAAVVVADVIRKLEDLLTAGEMPAAASSEISRTLSRAQRLKEIIIAARRGDTLAKG